MTKPNILGAVALLLYIPHAIWHLRDGSAWDLLWVCNVAVPTLALGCFLRLARLCVVAFLFLVYGTPLWLIDTVAGGPMVPTSPLIHVGGLAVALLAIRVLRWPPRSWLVAAAASAAVLGITYLVSPAGPNVNLAFRVQAGWEPWFSNHALYVAVLWLSAAGTFWVLERLARRRLTQREAPTSP